MLFSTKHMCDTFTRTHTKFKWAQLNEIKSKHAKWQRWKQCDKQSSRVDDNGPKYLNRKKKRSLSVCISSSMPNAMIFYKQTDTQPHILFVCAKYSWFKWRGVQLLIKMHKQKQIIKSNSTRTHDTAYT